MDANDYGTFGVLRFLKKNDDNAVVASYPIDDDEVTFGKESSCNVRLYYPAVSSLHAKVVFQDRKAFIVVLGPHGVLVDNCPVFPSASHGRQTTVPLPNNSLIEINKKRFRFEYPPKTLRTALINTPSTSPTSPAGRKRTLRLSMIQSAQVFTPRPDPDPRVNLRILQTPIRTSPLKQGHREQMKDEANQREGDDSDDGEEEPIVLVDGNRPRVVEEDKDLVILEDVELPETQPLRVQKRAPQLGAGVVSPRPRQASGIYSPQPAQLVQPHQQQFETPRRRPPRSSLHRAVLIRSAQRAALREIERQEEEERDVEAVEDVIMEDGAEEGEEDSQIAKEDEGGEEAMEYEEDVKDEEDEDRGREEGQGSSWFSGLQAVREGWRRFRSRSRSQSPTKDEQDDHEVEDDEDNDEEEEEPFHYDTPHKRDEDAQTVPVDARAGEHDESDDLAYNPHHFTPQRPQRPATAGRIAPFMTPQPIRYGNSLADRVRGIGRLSIGRGRISLGGQAWRVRDIDVRARSVSPVKEEQEGETSLQVPRPRVTAEERRAIQERRRSAMNMPDPLFGDCIPGSRRPSVTPAPKPESPFKDPTSFEAQMSPAKAWAANRRAKGAKGLQEAVEEEEEDTSVLLERMKGVVDGMKRRRSMHAEEDAMRASALPRPSEDNEENEREVPADEEHNTSIDTEAEVEAALGAPAPATPPMADLKHMFSQNRAAPSTPRLSGVGDMLATPPAYRARQQAEEEEEMQEVPTSDDEEAKHASHAAEEEDDEEEEDEPPARPTRPKKTPARAPAKAKPAPAPRTATAKSRTTASTRTRTPATGASSMADDELTPAVPPARSSKKAQLAGAPKGAVVRRTRRAEVDTEEDSPAVVVATKPSGRGRKAESSSRSTAKGKAVAEPQDDSPPAPARRTRKAVAEEPAPAPAPKASTRKTTRAAPTKTSSRTRSKTAESSKAVKEEEEEDPLDSLAQPDEEEEQPAPAPAPTKARRGRPRAATVASTTQDEDEESAPLRGTRSGTGRKMPARGAAAKGGVVGKENTPESGHASAHDEDGEEEQVVVVKSQAKTAAATTRSGGRRKAAQAQAQSEPEREKEKEKEVPVVGKTRATRSRAATGRG